MGKIQGLAIIVAVAGIGFFAWLHQHDKMVAFKAKAEQQVKQLDKDQKDIDGLRKAVVALDQAYAKERRQHELQLEDLHLKKTRYNHTIDSLLNQIARESPNESTKTRLAQLGDACYKQADLIYNALVVCESLRRQAEEQVGKRDTIIFRVQKARDSYKKLFEDSQKAGQPSSWATVGKIQTAAAIIAVVTKLLKFW